MEFLFICCCSVSLLFCKWVEGFGSKDKWAVSLYKFFDKFNIHLCVWNVLRYYATTTLFMLMDIEWKTKHRIRKQQCSPMFWFFPHAVLYHKKINFSDIHYVCWSIRMSMWNPISSFKYKSPYSKPTTIM